MISSVAIETPPANYGGLERVAYSVAEGLAGLGHTVELICSKGSTAPEGVRLLDTVEPWSKLNDGQRKMFTDGDGVERSWRDQKWRAHTYNGWRRQEEVAYADYESRLPDFDAVVDMSWSKWAYSSKNEAVVGVCHSIAPYQVKPPREFPMFVGVSRGHSHNLSKVLRVPVRTLWNPVDVEALPLETVKTDRILSFNRIMPQKGIHLFAALAEKLQIKGDIAGDDSTLVPDQNYVSMMKQNCAKSAYLSYHGLVDDRKRIQLLKDAKVLVCFKDAGYEEVFGLSAVEAMAMGTPVVAAKTWGMDDIIMQGKNGFVVNTSDEMEDVVKGIVAGTVKFDPTEVRATTERFSKKTIAKRYSDLLLSIKRGTRW